MAATAYGMFAKRSTVRLLSHIRSLPNNFPRSIVHIQPSLKQLQALHEFDIESQIQYLAPLSFEPRLANSAGGEAYYALTRDELEIFVNTAEWSLCTPSNYRPSGSI